MHCRQNADVDFTNVWYMCDSFCIAVYPPVSEKKTSASNWTIKSDGIVTSWLYPETYECLPKLIET